MKQSILFWSLVGALAGSAVLNVQLWQRAGRQSASSTSVPCDLRSCVELLQLTPEQVSQLAQSCGSCCETEASLGDEIDRARARLDAALERPDVDRAEVDRLAGQLSELRDRMLQCRVDTILGVRSILRPEQLALLRQRLTDAR